MKEAYLKLASLQRKCRDHKNRLENLRQEDAFEFLMKQDSSLLDLFSMKGEFDRAYLDERNRPTKILKRKNDFCNFEEMIEFYSYHFSNMNIQQAFLFSLKLTGDYCKSHSVMMMEDQKDIFMYYWELVGSLGEFSFGGIYEVYLDVDELLLPFKREIDLYGQLKGEEKTSDIVDQETEIRYYNDTKDLFDGMRGIICEQFLPKMEELKDIRFNELESYL